MDARKIQFLIGMQREIDKLEAKEGNTPKVEKVKSRFYDVVEVEEVVNTSSQAKQDTDTKTSMLIPEAEGNATTLSNKLQLRRYTPEERKDNLNKLEKLKKDVGLTDKSLPVMKRKNPAQVKKKINPVNDHLNDKVQDLVLTRKNPEGSKKKLAIVSKENEVEPEKAFPHKPKDVAAFLVRFRDRKNRGLKYLTHRWSDMKRDNPLTYAEVIANATKEFWECSKQETIPIALKSKIGQYVSAKSITEIVNGEPKIIYPHFYYSTVIDGVVKRINIYSGWSSDEMIKWVKDNPNSDPNQDDYWKKELIQPFKQAIEVRDGMFEEYMKMNAEAILKDDYKKFSPIYSDSLKEARFFTDVPTLFEGIRKLLAAAKDRAKEPALRFEYHIPDSTDMYGVRQIKIITDKNSDIGSSLITKAQLVKGGDLGDAFEYFYGLCNWSILCKRGNDFVKINLLTDVDGIPEIEVIDEKDVDGFTHVLAFYDL